ncbi:hypothetical protein EDC01DRAFT_788562 [Geopyxis carbonaria]|nr:hypothetical protein EDC01DRAFT_788562 [Geopyxis carbonaria]
MRRRPSQPARQPASQPASSSVLLLLLLLIWSRRSMGRPTRGCKQDAFDAAEPATTSVLARLKQRQARTFVPRRNYRQRQRQPSPHHAVSRPMPTCPSPSASPMPQHTPRARAEGLGLPHCRCRTHSAHDASLGVCHAPSPTQLPAVSNPRQNMRRNTRVTRHPLCAIHCRLSTVLPSRARPIAGSSPRKRTRTRARAETKQVETKRSGGCEEGPGAGAWRGGRGGMGGVARWTEERRGKSGDRPCVLRIEGVGRWVELQGERASVEARCTLRQPMLARPRLPTPAAAVAATPAKQLVQAWPG